MEKVAFPSLFQTIKCQNRWELGHLILLCMMQTIFFHQSSSSIQPNPPSFLFRTPPPLCYITPFLSNQSINKPHHHQFHIHTNTAHEETVELSGTNSILNQVRRCPLPLQIRFHGGYTHYTAPPLPTRRMLVGYTENSQNILSQLKVKK